MTRLKGCFIVGILCCTGVASSARVECGRWTTKTLPGPEWRSNNDYMYMAYDENLQKPVLYAYQKDDQDNWEVRLWTYDGDSWDLLWTGAPIMDPGWHFGPTSGMVFDQNRQALVIFGTISYQLPENGCLTAYQFLPGQGWERIYGCIQITASTLMSRLTVTYDTIRKRAIIIGGGEYQGSNNPGPPITIEFDGWAIEIKKNPPEFKLYYGSAGFDPGRGKVVFYGYGREFEEGEVLETFEYDGTTWTLIATDQRPETQYHPISGLSYAPGLHGLIGVPSNRDPFQTWIYKAGEWSHLPFDGDLNSRLYGVMQWDLSKKMAVYWGGRVYTDEGLQNSKDTLELKASVHCRPVARPTRLP